MTNKYIRIVVGKIKVRDSSLRNMELDGG